MKARYRVREDRGRYAPEDARRYYRWLVQLRGRRGGWATIGMLATSGDARCMADALNARDATDGSCPAGGE